MIKSKYLQKANKNIETCNYVYGRTEIKHMYC